MNEARKGRFLTSAGLNGSSFNLRPSSFALVLLALLGDGPGEHFDLRAVPTDLILDDLAQGDVRRAEVGIVRDERTTHAAATGVQLAHAPGDDVDENVGGANLLQSFFAEFSVHNIIQSEIERVRLADNISNAM